MSDNKRQRHRPEWTRHERAQKSTRSLDTERELHTHVDLAGHLDHLRELDGLLGSTLEVFNGEDLEAGVVDLSQLAYWLVCSCKSATYQLVGLLHVGTLQPGHDRSAETHLMHNVDQALGDGITPDNTTEDVNEDGRDLGVTGDKLESRLDGGRGSTTTDIKEVGGAAAIDLDDIHSGHGKASTIDYTN